jgi:hypothetical protein
MAEIRKGSDDDTLCGVPESSSNLLEGRRRRFRARFLKSTAHFFLFPQNLLLALCNDGVAQFWASIPDSAGAHVPQLGRDFID